MYYKKRLIFVFSLVSFLISTHSAFAKPLNIVIGLAKPPYVIEKPLGGFEIELINLLLKKMKSSGNFIFVPFGRSERMLKEPGIDVILTVNDVMFPKKGTLSDVYITYQNVAISLEENNFSINTIKDLSNYSLATFQSAHKVLGDEFALASQESPLYTQVANQALQLDMLLKKRADVLIMDINIFNYYLKHYSNKKAIKPIRVHKVFPVSPYKAAFKDKQHQYKFNQSLIEVLASPDYQKLIAKYNLVTAQKN